MLGFAAVSPRVTSLPLLALLSAPLLVGACDKEGLDADLLAEDETPRADEPEPCAEHRAMRDCADGEGTQFCDYAPGSWEELEWGACLTDFECMPGEVRSCGLGEEFGDLNYGCGLVDGVPAWAEDACNTPLVLSFDGGPIQTLSSAAAFDIAGAGVCLATDWPTSHNPWLAIDLDRNGFIDGGHELFGSGSRLDSGAHASNGFIALATLDSNGDGQISPLDDRFAEILVWRDDGDKLSLPSELSTLVDEGVTAIDLAYEVREQCDARGNCGRERSRMQFVDRNGQPSVGEVVDLYLACQ
jgi:hypothetical protein